MADVELNIGGRRYSVACRDGGEAHLATLARHVDRKAAEARAAVGDATEARQLLFAALLLADEMAENAGGHAPASPAPPPSPVDPALVAAFARIADRIEAVADALENT